MKTHCETARTVDKKLAKQSSNALLLGDTHFVCDEMKMGNGFLRRKIPSFSFGYRADISSKGERK